MKHLQLTLGYLREQRAKFDNAIQLCETLLGTGNGNGHRSALKLAADALAIHEMNGNGHAKHAGGRPKGSKTKSKHGTTWDGKPRQRAVQNMKPLPTVDIPNGLDLSELPIMEAIPAALKARKKPANTKELAALLIGAGFKVPESRMPFTTFVGSLCGRQGKSFGVKGNKNGWALRG
jgi:hypothetical protein